MQKGHPVSYNVMAIFFIEPNTNGKLIECHAMVAVAIGEDESVDPPQQSDCVTKNN